MEVENETTVELFIVFLFVSFYMFLHNRSMKSYGDNFKGTKLRLSLLIKRSNNTQSEKVYEISGYHETKTSIHLPHKLELPEGGANTGDTVLVNAELVSGSYFKINGIALCSC